MSTEHGLRVCVGTASRLPGFLSMGTRDDSDVPFHAGEDFPFEDRAIDAIDCGAFVDGLARGARVHFLLECRRTLKPGGIARLVTRCVDRIASGEPVVDDQTLGVRDEDASAWDLPRLGSLVGLEAVEQVPVAAHCRDAIATLPTGDPHGTLIEFGKRDRQVVGDPLVSILIPAYNAAFFAACLDSALAQTYDNIEIVVCDDSAGPEIESIVLARASRRNVRYVRNQARLGVRGNYRRCFERARGDFAKFLCDDDLLAPTCVASLLDAFRRTPDIVLATSHRQRIDANGTPLDEQPATVPIVEDSAVIVGYSLANAMLMAGLNVVGEPSTTLFRKADLVDQAPDYFCFHGVQGHGIIDMVMWSALLLKGDAVYLRDSLSSFRIHPGQRQHDPSKFQRNIDSIRRLQAAWLDLKMNERVPRNRLLARPFPAVAEHDWEQRPLPALTSAPFVPRGRSMAPGTAIGPKAGSLW